MNDFGSSSQIRRPPKRRRKFNVGILPSEGYWSNGIQKVVRKWRPKIGKSIFDENITSLMISCHYLVTRDEYRRRRRRLSIELALVINDVCEHWKNRVGDAMLNSILPAQIAEFMEAETKIDSHTQSVFGNNKRFILELILAVDDLWHTDNLDRWILEFGFSGDGSDYENDVPTPRSYKKIRRLIKSKTSHEYEERTISKRAERLKLT